MLTENLRHCMLAPSKLHSELRIKGHACMSKVFAVVLEPTGTFAVITDGELGLACRDSNWAGSTACASIAADERTAPPNTDDSCPPVCPEAAAS
jgi:uncharacterized membrane protein YcaP (DUF421 family)